jgi:peptidoglycan/xylan/chitin deacetylase (PgdA/CDA1 family)
MKVLKLRFLICCIFIYSFSASASPNQCADFKEGWETWDSVDSYNKKVALTFDDGPNLETTPIILNILGKYKIKATFFVIGERIKNPEHSNLVKRIIKEGHTLGNHSWNHPYFTEISQAKAKEQFSQTDLEISKFQKVRKYFRYPYGQSTCEINDYLEKKKVKFLGWNVDSCDWVFSDGKVTDSEKKDCSIRNDESENMVDLVLNRLEETEGGILLLHDIHLNTAMNLESLIKKMKKNGFTFTDLEDESTFPELNKDFLINNSNIEEVKNTKWRITKSEWGEEEEKNFSEFVTHIGNAREKNICNSVDSCLKSKLANPKYYLKNPRNFKIYSDCADLPFILKAYFSWMNDLAFAFPSEVRSAVVSIGDNQIGGTSNEDLRYTLNGNTISNHYFVKNGDDIKTILASISNTVSSAMYRVHPKQDVETSVKFPDFYPVKIEQNSIKAGTILYDPAGHVLIVYKVEKNGRIKLIDAHPDNSLTRQVYGDKFMRDNPAAGAGFKAFRPFKIVNNKIIFFKNEQISNYSLEQFYGNIPSKKYWDKGKFIFNDEEVNYYDYVKNKLSSQNAPIDPIYEFKEMMSFLCDDLHYRNEAIQKAVDDKISLKNHPETLPRNIYGTDGEWETYSSPSRDSRFKASVREVRLLAQNFVEKNENGDDSVKYDGKDLKNDLHSLYKKMSLSCEVTYKNSQNIEKSINLDQAIDRVYQFSFDPYHCPELRWGEDVTHSQSCPDSKNKRDWYDAEQELRNVIKRDYSKTMNVNLDELKKSQLGISQEEEISIKAYFKN